MSTVKISQLPVLPAPQLNVGDTLVVVHDGITYQMQVQALVNYLPAGAEGSPGAEGPPGAGVPTGGSTGQLLAKADSADYNTQWVAPQITVAATAPGSPTVNQLWVDIS